MTRFQKIKSAIKAQNESTKYFNKTFLETFENARETMAQNIKKGVECFIKEINPDAEITCGIK